MNEPAPEPAAPTPGGRLRAEREKRGLSPQKAADELHLDAWVILALEADDYERVGPSVYAKGHLKRYAALLGVPGAEILTGYESRAQVPKAAPSPPAGVRLRTDAAAVGNLPWPQIGGCAAVVLLIIGVLWWKPWHQRGTRPAPNPAAARSSSAASANSAIDSSVQVGPAAAGAVIPGVALPGAALPPASLAGAASTPAAMTPAVASVPAPAVADASAGVGRARLRLSFSADSWVDVHDAAGKRVFAGKGRANSVRTLAGIAPMRVYLGFASGVQLEINNRAVAIGPQFVAGDVARFEAGADGVLRRDLHSVPGRDEPPRGTRPPG